ncbi:MAG: hypothetical protein QOC68_3975 [Solirubrobacteraceae bacterium]|jgi:uncharacterized protein with FMN-binding domain|nr:hypothetical protein [Solirubrobacteraceae bacterium]
MRKAVVALVVTVAAVILLVGFDTRPPRTLNPNSALRAKSTPRALARPRPTPSRAGRRSATGPALVTPFSVIQVRATLMHGRLVGVETVTLSGDGPHTEAINARAEPLLRAEALKAHSADIDVVTGATYTSRSWKGSLQAAIDKARG